jgi:hypothetical protein
MGSSQPPSRDAGPLNLLTVHQRDFDRAISEHSYLVRIRPKKKYRMRLDPAAVY